MHICLFLIVGFLHTSVSGSPFRIRRQQQFNWGGNNNNNKNNNSDNVPPTTTQTSTNDNLTNPQTLACMKSCPSTYQYNPVCGSNKVTYSNEGRLRCAAQCGVRVTKQFGGKCSSTAQVF